MSRLYAILLVGLLMGACASTADPPVQTAYHAKQNQTIYQSRGILISELSHTSDLRPTRWVRLQALGACTGKACQPSSFALQFLLESNTPMRIYHQQVVFRTQGRVFEWSKESMRSRYQRKRRPVASTPRLLAEVQVSPDTLRTLAEAKPLRGQLGSTRFKLSYDELAPFRELLTKATGNEPSQTTGNEPSQ